MSYEDSPAGVVGAGTGVPSGDTPQQFYQPVRNRQSGSEADDDAQDPAAPTPRLHGCARGGGLVAGEARFPGNSVPPREERSSQVRRDAGACSGGPPPRIVPGPVVTVFITSPSVHRAPASPATARMSTAPSPPNSARYATTPRRITTWSPASTSMRRRAGVSQTGPSSGRCSMRQVPTMLPSRRSWSGSARASRASASTPSPSSPCCAGAASASSPSPSTPTTPPPASSWRRSSRASTSSTRKILRRKSPGACARPPRAVSGSPAARPTATTRSTSRTGRRSARGWSPTATLPPSWSASSRSPRRGRALPRSPAPSTTTASPIRPAARLPVPAQARPRRLRRAPAQREALRVPRHRPDPRQHPHRVQHPRSRAPPRRGVGRRGPRAAPAAQDDRV